MRVFINREYNLAEKERLHFVTDGYSVVYVDSVDDIPGKLQKSDRFIFRNLPERSTLEKDFIAAGVYGFNNFIVR